MKIKCDYCQSYISDTDEKCPNCGATNRYLRRSSNGAPTTIEELKQWYVDHNLPDENVTRFFIGKNYEKPRAFGIYFDEDSRNYVVYKNKDTGERKIRYEGKDEAYAVNELYLKLKEEIANQKSRNRNKSSRGLDFNPFKGKLFIVHFISVFIVVFSSFFIGNIIPGLFLFLSINPGIFIMMMIYVSIKNEKVCSIIDKIWHIGSLVICFILILICIFMPKYIHRNDAYYSHNGEIYYRYGNDWYYYNNNCFNGIDDLYNDCGSWVPYRGSTDGFDYLDDDYSSSFGTTDFEDSSYYGDNNWYSSSSSSSSSDWDSGSSWDSSDSWDSGGSDWGSDW